MSTIKPMQLYELPKPVQLAVFFGIIHDGWNIEDYMVEAIIDPKGYETCCIWGLQGVGKSSFMITILFWLYHAYFVLQYSLSKWTFETLLALKEAGDFEAFLEAVRDVQDTKLTPSQLREIWEMVLDCLVFKPAEFTLKLENVPEDVVLPALGWDDIGVHYPSSKFKTDIEQYEAIDSTWAAIRTAVHVVVLTIPIIDRLAKNVKDNLTIEIFVGKNQKRLVNRLFHLPGLRSIESSFFKAVLEAPEQIDLTFVPFWVWQKYWAMRIKLTREALSVLRKATDMIDVENYITVLDAAEMCFQQNVKWSTSTIQQDYSRGIIKGAKIAGVLCVKKEDFFRVLVLKGGISPLD